MINVILVGAGYMAKEYAVVLKDIGISFEVIGRSKKSAGNFEKEIGIPVKNGGLETVFDTLNTVPTHAIVATTIESLELNTLFLIEKGIKNILVEKPGALTSEGIHKIKKLAKEKNANVYIAYNRRFYASVLEAKKRIELDGGLSSFLFEFTEWSHLIHSYNKTDFQLNNWFIGNSTHVIDTAFFFGGKPREISTYVQSKLDWHPKGSIYSGAGITDKDVLFSYHANWSAPGSWKLELLTRENRYIFRPFEKLQIQKLGNNAVEEVEMDYMIDTLFKPGIYKQTETFLTKNSLTDNLLDIETAYKNIEIYEKFIKNK